MPKLPEHLEAMVDHGLRERRAAAVAAACERLTKAQAAVAEARRAVESRQRDILHLVERTRRGEPVAASAVVDAHRAADDAQTVLDHLHSAVAGAQEVHAEAQDLLTASGRDAHNKVLVALIRLRIKSTARIDAAKEELCNAEAGWRTNHEATRTVLALAHGTKNPPPLWRSLQEFWIRTPHWFNEPQTASIESREMANIFALLPAEGE